MIKWVVRLAFITALLGIVGTILILTNLSPKKEEKEIRRDEKKDTTPINSLKIDSETPKPQPKLPPPAEEKPVVVEKENQVVIENRKPMVAEKPKPIVVEKKEEAKPKVPVPDRESEEKIRDLLAKKEENKKKQAKLDALKKAQKEEAKAEALKKAKEKELAQREAEEKLFTVGELQQIVARINAVKEENDIYSNCVQMHITRKGNNSRTISQVETYLRSQRFAIAGREVIERKVKGIQVSPTANCVRITIGTF